jgi:hypothetical protein
MVIWEQVEMFAVFSPITCNILKINDIVFMQTNLNAGKFKSLPQLSIWMCRTLHSQFGDWDDNNFSI